jgi:hypothetical protein
MSKVTMPTARALFEGDLKSWNLASPMPVAWSGGAEEYYRAFRLLRSRAESDCKKIGTRKVGSKAPRPLAWVVIHTGAMTIELFLKAVCARKKTKIEPQHNLLKLSDDAELDLSDSEKILLKRLTEMLVWAGRYPAPKMNGKDESRIFENSIVNGKYRSVHSVTPQDFQDIGEFIGRLRAEMMKLNKKATRVANS